MTTVTNKQSNESVSHKEKYFKMGTCKRGSGGRFLCTFEPVEHDTIEAEDFLEDEEILDAALIESTDEDSDINEDSDSEPEDG